MPPQTYSKQIVLKALKWLDNQPGNWAELIKDQNIAVKMYLKSQRKNRSEESSFKKELRPFLKTETKESLSFKEQNWDKEQELGAFLKNRPETPSPQEENFHPPSTKDSKELFLSKSREVLKNKDLSENRPLLESQNGLDRVQPLESQKQEAVFLDEKSRQALEKTKQQLNLQKGEEALRLLIQLGRNSLKKLFHKP